MGVQTIYNPIHGVLLVTAVQSSDQWTQYNWVPQMQMDGNAELTSDYPFHKRDRQ